MANVVHCKIEMDLIEGEHFRLSSTENELKDLRDDFVISRAETAFIDMINSLDNDGDLHEWVQSRIVRENG